MNNQLILDSILFVGKVISVKGRTVEVLVSKTKNSSTLLYNGEIVRNVSVGSYIKISKGFEELVGKIDGEEVTEDTIFSDKEYKHKREKIKRILSVKLLGYFEGNNFKQGVKELPLIDNESFLLTQGEIDKIHNFIKFFDGQPDVKIKIGNLSNEASRPIEIGVNSLLASHIGIFGNTGSGKSYTLASIYKKIFDNYSNKDGFKEKAKFLLFDFNGEFSTEKCINENKRVYDLTTRKQLSQIDNEDKLPLNESTLVDSELLSILSNATEKTQKPFVSRVVNQYKRVHNANDSNAYFNAILKNKVVDILNMTYKQKAYSLIEYMAPILLDEENPEENTETLKMDLEWFDHSGYFMAREMTANIPITEMQIYQRDIYRRANTYVFPENTIKKVIHFFYLQLIIDVYNEKALYEHVGHAINKLKSKIGDLEKVINFDSVASNYFEGNNLVIVNLNETNIETRKLIPLLVAKHIYNEHKINNREDGSKYLNIIIDEAHNILSYNSERESETWKDYRLETFEEIIKEGRKFGVFLTVASQRPSDISDTIISQLHNYFIHRLINDFDIQKVERTISYLDRVSAESLSILPTGTCILAGICAHIPVIVDIDKIPEEYEPQNKTMIPAKYWV